jgi:hypothetical protein
MINRPFPSSGTLLTVCNAADMVRTTYVDVVTQPS